MLLVALGTVLGLLVGWAIGYVVHVAQRARVASRASVAEARLAEMVASRGRAEDELRQMGERLAQTEVARARVEERLTSAASLAEERAQSSEEGRQQLLAEFSRLSQEALRSNNEQFMTLADSRLAQAQEAAKGELTQRQQAIESLVSPLREQLGRYEESVRQLERQRDQAYRGLLQQVEQLGSNHDELRRETKNLASALRSPSIRGRWGELQLRKVVELAGMVEHCDFDVQVSALGDEGRKRPDMVTHLPGGRQVVVDAKVPLEAFQAASASEDESEQRTLMAGHAKQVRKHIEGLAKKEYWRQFDRSPAFVVAFIPGDPLLAAAFEHDPSLMEYAFANHVALATPNTLIPLLWTVAYGWQEDALAENARTVQKLGNELYQRLSKLSEHFTKMGRSLGSAVAAYNDAVGSMESRVLVTARRFPELGVVGHGDRQLAPLEPIVTVPRSVQAVELAGPVPADEAIEVPVASSLKAWPDEAGSHLQPALEEGFDAPLDPPPASTPPHTPQIERRAASG